MNWPFSELARTKRRAKRLGKSHGRQGLPDSDWNGGPVPFLEALHAWYTQKIESLEQRLRIVEGQSITSLEEDVATKQSQEYQIAQLEQERSLYENRLATLLEQKTGEPKESPISRAARHRHIPIPIYIIALIALGIGEYFVTLPAVKILLNDDPFNAIIITGSFSALSILAAHIIGLTFKIDIDREETQPIRQRIGAGVIFIFINLVVLLLSAIRSKTVSGVPVRFGLSDKQFGTFLFYIVQITFILCAIALSYYNHSQVESELTSTRRRIKRITSNIRNITKSRLIPSRGNLTPEKREVQIKAILTHMHSFEAEYREVCAIYRGANLLAQKNAFPNPGPGLTEKPLFVPDARMKEEI